MLAGLGAETPAAEARHTLVQVPGYYRIKIGDVTVTALYDGYIYIGTPAYANIAPAEAGRLFAERFETEPKGAAVSVNAFLLQRGGKVAMIDGGTSDCFGPTMGRLPESLKAAGYSPDEVEAVLITHMHGDHVCGLAGKNGERLFPRAQVWASAAEIGYWLDEKHAAAAPANRKSYFAAAVRGMGPYRAAGALHGFKPGEAPVAGITPVATPGHTPGHTSYLVSSQGENLLIWGDIVHGVALQFVHPEATIMSDSDQARAAASRRETMAKAADDRWLVAGAHLPFPGIGHVRREGAGYAFVPVEYMPL